MLRRTRKLVKADIRQIDPLNCGSTIGYSIIEGRRGIYADMDLTDCNRKITWNFAQRDGDGVLNSLVIEYVVNGFDHLSHLWSLFAPMWEHIETSYQHRRIFMDKPKTVKTCFIEGSFPELVVKNMYQQGRGEGGNIRVACANAVKDLLRKPALRGRRITSAKLTVAFGFKVVDETPKA